MLHRLAAAIKNMMRAFFSPPSRPATPAGAGKRSGPDDELGGAGVTAPLKPPPPVLVGRDAKPLPPEEEDRYGEDLAA
jgi:hypothetical protein